MSPQNTVSVQLSSKAFYSLIIQSNSRLASKKMNPTNNASFKKVHILLTPCQKSLSHNLPNLTVTKL